MLIFELLCILALISICIIYIISAVQDKMIKTVNYSVDSSKLPKSFEGYKIALISDIHGKSFGKDGGKLYESIKAINPDIICLAGDAVTCVPNNKDVNMAAGRLVKKISEIAPVYFGEGNHEEGIGRKLLPKENYKKEFVDSLGDNVIYLPNESAFVSKGKDKLTITGLTIKPKFYVRTSREKMTSQDVVERVGELDSDVFNILLAHNPDFFEAYEGYDLIFAGHNHGGIIRLPLLGGVISPKLRIFPKYCFGKFVNNNTTMIVSSGLGTHSRMPRAGNIPEVCVVTLHRK